MSDCSQCGGTGWKTVTIAGVSRAAVCDCRKQKPAGLTPIAEIVSNSKMLSAMLTPKDKDIAAIIAKRQGAALAISINDIARQVAGELAGEGDVAQGSPSSPAALLKMWERSIKDSVRRLRRSGMRIGSCRNPKPGTRHPAAGYFVITTADELRSTVRPLLRQAIDELRTIEALTGKGMFAAELEGQARLFEQVPGVRGQVPGKDPDTRNLKPETCSPPEAR